MSLIAPHPLAAHIDQWTAEGRERRRTVEVAAESMSALGLSAEQMETVARSARAMGASLLEVVNSMHQLSTSTAWQPERIYYELQGEPIADVDGIIVWSRQRVELSEAKASIAQPPPHGADAAGLLIGFVV